MPLGNTECGLIAAFFGVIGFGAFGAPLKGEAANSVDPDPFVLQTYKSTIYFLTSFFILLLGQEFTFSPYGLLSGLLWVIGGASGIFGIRNCGLALSVGLWSAITVFVSFGWGIFIFGERVVSIPATLSGITFLVAGFVGMAYFSSPEAIKAERRQSQNEDDNVDAVINMDTQTALNQHLLEEQDKDEEQQRLENTQNSDKPGTISLNIEENMNGLQPNSDNSENDDDDNIDETKVKFLGMIWNRRRLGILGAAVDGVFGGAAIIPMHYSSYHGEEYILSFAIGAMIVTIVFWIIRWSYNSYEQKSLSKGFHALPPMHFKTLVFPGALAGTIWSLGNTSQIMAVYYLGESIGMSIVQSSMIVSGLLGILWFGEIKGRKAIFWWSMSAIVTFIGIIMLSHQHKA
jgi:glucose uptake protein GlcU